MTSIKNSKENSKIVAEIILNDFKYISVRFLYQNWFFPAGAEVANQLIDNIIKVYLRSIGQHKIIRVIRGWRGNESHNTVRMIERVTNDMGLDFDLDKHKSVLENIYKIYQNRYLDSLKKTGSCKTILNDIHTIDYTYKYFRDRIKISEDKKEETLINKLFMKGKDLKWGIYKISLYSIFCEDNRSFRK